MGQKSQTDKELYKNRIRIVALELYTQNKLTTNSDIVISKSGLWISPEHCFLGASPNAAIYDPSEKEPYGFVEIKCPYKHKNNSSPVACENANFCCIHTIVDGKQQIENKKENWIFRNSKDKWRPRSDFVYILNQVHIQRINFNVDFWKSEFTKDSSFLQQLPCSRNHSSSAHPKNKL